MVRFCETKSVTQTQTNFRTHYQKDPPSRNSIIDWKKKILETGSVLGTKSSGRPSKSSDDADRVREAFARSPRKSLETYETGYILWNYHAFKYHVG